MATVLITGGTGFIGSHVVEALLKQGHQVTVLSRHSTLGWRLAAVAEQLHQITWEDNQQTEDWFTSPDDKYVVHLSTFYSKTDHPEQLQNMVQANIAQPMNLLELAAKSGVKGFVNTGTFFEYKPSSTPLTESSSIDPVNLYARTKVGFESILSSYATTLPSVSLRLFSPFGERDNPKLVNYLIENLLQQTPIKLSSGYQRLDFIHAKDIANAYVKAIDYLAEQTSGHSAINIGSGEATSIRQLVDAIQAHLKMPADISWAAGTESDRSSISLADISKAKQLLNWRPLLTLSEGLENTIRHHQASQKS